MINSLNINIIEPPANAVFSYRRNVLFEKLNKRIHHYRTNGSTDFTHEYIENLIQTKAHPGNQVWIIKDSLDVEVYTIARIIHRSRYPDSKTDGKVLFYGRNGKADNVYIYFNKFMECVDYNSYFFFGCDGIGNCHICSSESEMLYMLKNHLITRKITFLKTSLKERNMQIKKLEYNKKFVKRLLKIQKEIEKELK